MLNARLYLRKIKIRYLCRPSAESTVSQRDISMVSEYYSDFLYPAELMGRGCNLLNQAKREVQICLIQVSSD